MSGCGRNSRCSKTGGYSLASERLPLVLLLSLLPFLVILLGLSSSGLALAASGSAGEQGQEQERVRVLIGLQAPSERPGGRREPEGWHLPHLISAPVEEMEAELEALGGRVEHRFQVVSALLAEVPYDSLSELETAPWVSYIEPDGEVRAPEPEPLTPREEGLRITFEWLPWGVDRIDAEVVHHPPSAHPGALALGSVLLVAFLAGVRMRVRARSSSRRMSRRGRGPLPLALGPGLGVGVGVAVLALALAVLLGGCELLNIRIRPSTVGPRGEGVNVALLDTGLDPDHPDLRANYRGGYDFVNGDPDPRDDNGHGTQVAGVLGARENGFGLVGVAPRVNLWELKVLDSHAQGSISDVVRGLEWALEHGMQIVNMSLGTPEDSRTLREAVRAAWEAGLVLIAPVGNESGRVLYPAAYPEVIAVGAIDREGELAWFSNTGPEVELVAPGEEIPTTYLEGGYRLASGTSFAAPHVAGVAALLISAGVEDNEEVRRRLISTAEDLGLEPYAQGYGLVDAEHAVLGSTSGDN